MPAGRPGFTFTLPPPSRKELERRRKAAEPGERAAGPDPAPVRARTVEADFQALRAWCQNEWYYCVIVLSVYKAGVKIVAHAASLWGIDLNHPAGDNGYLTEVANELLDEAVDEGIKTLDKLCCVG